MALKRRKEVPENERGAVRMLALHPVPRHLSKPAHDCYTIKYFGYKNDAVYGELCWGWGRRKELRTTKASLRILGWSRSSPGFWTGERAGAKSELREDALFGEP